VTAVKKIDMMEACTLMPNFTVVTLKEKFIRIT